MRNPTEVRVTHGVLHLVGEGRDRRTVLSEELLDLGAQPEAHDFIAAHIFNSLHAEQALAGRFTDAQGVVATACRTIFDHPRRLLAASHQITRSLGGIVGEDRRIANGGLLIAQFQVMYDGHEGNGYRHVAILKLDPSAGFVPDAQQRNGHTRVVLRKVDRVIPTTREQLQKCAFACHPEGRQGLPDGCDLLVLDRQRRGDDQPADFFMTRFLGAARATDDITLTQTFGDIAVRTIQKLRHDGLIDDEVRNELYTHRAAALRSQTVNVTRFIDDLPITPAARDVARERFAEMADREFHPDEATAIKLTRTMRFRGDHGLQLAVQSDHFGEVVEPERIENDAQRGPHWKVTLRTRIWEQVRGR